MRPNFEAKAVAVVDDAVIEIDESLCEVLDAGLVDMSPVKGELGLSVENISQRQSSNWMILPPILA
jgi:hypothetical protein